MPLDPTVNILSGVKILRGSAAPSGPTGTTFSKGDIILNNAPAQGQPLGWVCTVGGDPGTWRALANIQ